MPEKLMRKLVDIPWPDHVGVRDGIEREFERRRVTYRRQEHADPGFTRYLVKIGDLCLARTILMVIQSGQRRAGQ